MKTKHIFYTLAALFVLSLAVFAASKKREAVPATEKSVVLPPAEKEKPRTSDEFSTGEPAQRIQPTEVSQTEVFAANEPSGIIGAFGGRMSDNPEDNLFSVSLAEKPAQTDRVWLHYELDGVASGAGVSKSINDRPAAGGYLTVLHQGYTPQREELDPRWLEKGENRILFTLPADAAYGYAVRGVRLEVEKGAAASHGISPTRAETAGNSTYVHGFVPRNVTRVTADEVELTLHEGEFEGLLPARARLELTAHKADGTRLTQTVTSLFAAQTADFTRPMDKEVASVKKSMQKAEAAELALAGSKLVIGDSVLLKNKTLSLTALREVDLPALDYGMTNVTAQNQGYRFLPHGTHFAQKGATVSLAYDRTKIPSGYTEDDIRTYYFDNQTKHWVALKRDSVDKTNQLIVSATTHFTDMINGVIQAPESPETEGFAPTMMNDIKAADPTAKLNVIAPPSANQRGSADLEYGFEMPPARNGMAPSLGIRYSSEGGSGWLGEGWNLTLPAIAVDTRWGVPRYNTQKETETYSMSGSMLTTTAPDGTMSVAHRGEKIDRKADRQFYTRQGGDFARIIRKGDNPAGYTWEVTDKQGTKYTYGGNGGVLKGTITDITGQSREVVSEWKLSRVEETHGDWIEYSYAPADEPVRQGLTAKALYLVEARAGNAGEQAHTVVAFESKSQKELKTNNARYGFLASSNRLLDKLSVAYRGENLRSYTFTYKKGAFFKEILQEIKQLDNNGGEFAHQKFDYYDDVQSAQGYVPFKNETEKWNTGDDDIKKLGVGTSAINGSQSTGFSIMGYVGVGAMDASYTKSTTGGLQYTYSNSTTRGRESLIDINGDGLPDKVFMDDSRVYFRANLNNGVFAEKQLIANISDFSRARAVSHSTGIKGNVGWGNLVISAGAEKNWGKVKTSIYFSDVNGDGLPDLCKDGRVLFNYIKTDAQGNTFPTFVESSSLTPSPIVNTGNIDTSAGEVDPEEQTQLIENSPMHDVVRVWQAPFDGTVQVESFVQLQLPQGDYDQNAYEKADGVRVAIQVKGNEVWNKSIAKGDGTAYPANVSSVTVKRGDRIYFRVQSGNQLLSNGAFDQVEWSSTITYTSKTGSTTPDNYGMTVYKSDEGNVVSQISWKQLQNSKTIPIKGTFTKPVTSDDVVLRVWGANDKRDVQGNENPNYRKQILYEKTFVASEARSGEFAFEVNNPDQFGNFLFEVYASTNVAWEKVRWAPVMGGDSTSQQILVYYHAYALHSREGNVYPVTQSGHINIKPTLKFTAIPGFPAANANVTLSVKSIEKLLAKKTFVVTNGEAPANISIDSLAVKAGNLWIEYTVDDFFAGVQVSEAQVAVTRLPDTTSTTVATNVFVLRPDEGFGVMHRGWGQFIYNSAEGRYAYPIRENLLKFPDEEDKDKANLLTMPFIPFSVEQQSFSYWKGLDPDVWVNANKMSTSRLGEKDVILSNPLSAGGNMSAGGESCLQGTGARSIILESAQDGEVVTAGGGVSVVNGHLSRASGREKIKYGFTDMNGDGFPDIISPQNIQYTNTLGGFDGEILQGGVNQASKNSAVSLGIGATGVKSFSNKTGQNTTSNQFNTAWDNANAGVSGSGSMNDDFALTTLLDVNGDGLPDKVLEDKRVQINLGYSFSAPVAWDIEHIQVGNSQTLNGGVSGGISRELEEIAKGGFDIGASSFSGGYGVTKTTTQSDYTFMDVNGDGLPDKVQTAQNGDIQVALNKGNGFHDFMTWKGASTVEESNTIAHSLNASGTITIQWLVKIAVTPGGSVSGGMSKTTHALRDVDGDGYLDIVTSDKDSEMHVTRSAIGRTNMLRSVTNSLGGRFEVDYKRSVPTYENPGSKWVLAQVTVDDGIRDDGPVMKTRFKYADGRRDRHEREFLGFAKVISKSIDTENSDAVYRRSIQEFDVRNYYTQGRLVKSRVEDAQGNPYAETVNEYDVYKLKASADNYAFTKDENICSDRGAAFVPLRYTANKQYEGASTGMITSEAWNEYYLDGHYGELKSYKYSDKGSLGANGNGNYDYQTSVTYAYNKEKYILGLPTQVTVSGGGQTYRQVTAAYDMNHSDHITNITQNLGGGQSAVTDFEYDRYGNITKKTLPANAKGQRMWYEYRYEPVMNMYVERVSDAFGYRSEVENFDYRYGVGLRHRDLNNFYSETEIDNMGRIVKVSGPNELADGLPYALAFEYQPRARYDENGITAPAYAITKHYDVQHPADPLETVTFVDGFGRAVQVKKDGVIMGEASSNSLTAPQEQTVMIVSGRAKFDAFGRVKEAFYPVTEAVGNKTAFNPAFDDVQPTKTVYDVLDRALTVTLPDNSETKTAYTLNTGDNALVTTVTDALGNKQASHTDGSGKTVKTEQFGGNNGTITTVFEYDGIDRLTKVTDTEGNETLSTYDMGDRRTEVNHPASGITKFTYDALGNVLSKQTANLIENGKFITYDYDYFRLVGVNYPDHPENNVKYHYGTIHASHNRIGRLMLREDGTGAEEYFYGKMGEVTKVRRTLIVPNQAIATYVTQWKYDSHNRLLEMIYPDEEKITYSYNLGGLLEKVRGYKSYGYDYVNKLGYDKFEQRSYQKYCNGAETFYTYDPARRRLSNLAVYSGKTNKRAIMDNAYTYDAVSNVLSVANNAPLPTGPAGGGMSAGAATGGQMQHSYTYDNLYRLATATGTYTGAEQKTAGYNLTMSYDNMHRITSKKQHITQKNVQFDGTLNAGYDLAYTYSNKAGKKFQLANVHDMNYRTEETPNKKTENNHTYSYDKNGNLIYVNTAQTKLDGTNEPKVNERKLRWDEENRLLAVDDNGFVSQYWYDADGERTVKTSGNGEAIYVNSLFSGGNTQTTKFTLYVSPYLVASQGGRYTKHIYVGSQRIVSKLGDLQSYGADPRRIPYAGSETDNINIDYKEKYAQQQQSIKDNYATFEVPYNGKDNDNYVDGGGFCCDDQPRMRSITPGQNDSYEGAQFYYHPDHLGSSSFITNLDGDVTQHIEYVPFGEVFIEERNNVWNTPYLFNAKELDEETGLYYYGARYYDSRISLWLSVDPLQEKYPDISSYCYTANNPVRFIDPDGKDWRDVLRGFSEAFIDDVNPNPVAPTVSSSSSASNESHYNIGQVLGHVAAGLVGATATIDGGKNMAAGAAVAIAGSETVVLIPVGGAMAVGGAVEAGYGIMVMGKAVDNIRKVGSINLNNNQKKQNASKSSTGIGSKNTAKGDKMGSNTKANKQIDDVAKKHNINRKDFGKYVEKSKMKEGKKGADNYSWKELDKMAKTYKEK